MKSIRVYCPVNTSASSITSIIPFERSSRMGHEIGHVFGVRETPTEEREEGERKRGREEGGRKEGNLLEKQAPHRNRNIPCTTYSEYMHGDPHYACCPGHWTRGLLLDHLHDTTDHRNAPPAHDWPVAAPACPRRRPASAFTIGAARAQTTKQAEGGAARTRRGATVHRRTPSGILGAANWKCTYYQSSTVAL